MTSLALLPSRRPLPLMLGFVPPSHLVCIFFSYPCVSVLTCPSSPSTTSTTQLQPLLRHRCPVGYSPACSGSPPASLVVPQEEFVDLVVAILSATERRTRLDEYLVVVHLRASPLLPADHFELAFPQCRTINHNSLISLALPSPSYTHTCCIFGTLDPADSTANVEPKYHRRARSRQLRSYRRTIFHSILCFYSFPEPVFVLLL